MEILHFWIAVHGSLSPERRKEFLARNELSYMMLHREKDVKACIRKHKKLRAIVACLRDTQASSNSSREDPPGGRGPKTSPTYKGSRPQTRSGRSRTRGEVWDRPAPYGTTDPRYK